MGRWIAGALVALLSLGAGSALATDAPASSGSVSSSCFTARDFESWKAPDDHTIYVRVAQKRYYRLDLVAKCPNLTAPTATLVTVFRGTAICSALDWDLKVSLGLDTIPTACIVKTMTELSAAQAAAIPEKFKP